MKNILILISVITFYISHISFYFQQQIPFDLSYLYSLDT